MAEARQLRNKNKNMNKKHTRKAPQFVILTQRWVAQGWISEQETETNTEQTKKEARAQQEQFLYDTLALSQKFLLGLSLYAGQRQKQAGTGLLTFYLYSLPNERKKRGRKETEFHFQESVGKQS